MNSCEMDTWYYSPYPEPYASLEKLHVCEFCLKYFGKEKTLIRHMAKCEMQAPARRRDLPLAPGAQVAQATARPPSQSLRSVARPTRCAAW